MMNKIANLPKFVSIAGLIVLIVLLYVTLQKGIMPLVMQVVQSDYFFQKEEEEAEELGKISNARSDQAFAQCKNAMVAEKHVPETAQFTNRAYEAWALGGRAYLVRAQVSIVGADNALQDRKYACKIKYNGGEMGDVKSWEILGVDFNEPN